MSEWVRLPPASTSEDCLTETLEGALEALSAVGIADPVVWVVAGDFCRQMLSGFVARCGDRSSRVRIGDSLRMEPSRLLRLVAGGRGIRAFAIATAGRKAWSQAFTCARAALVGPYRDGAVVCGLLAGSAYAVALRADGPQTGKATPRVTGLTSLVCSIEEPSGQIEVER